MADGEVWLLSPPAGARVLDTGAARWWSEGDYVCNQSYAEFVSAEDLRRGFRAALELSGGRRTALVAEAGPLSGTDREARDLLAGPEAAAVFTRIAFLVRSPVARTIMNLFVRLQSPLYPTRVFSDAAAARGWAGEPRGG